jgi:large subunit ribosomal protein L1
MAKNGKKYRAVKAKMPEGIIELADAVKFVKENSIAKFDETAELAFKLGVDPKKTEQSVRGTVALPHGTGRKVRILVFAGGASADAAKTAGADFVGNEDLIEKVKAGWTEFDIAIATPDAMKEVRKLGKVLGPRGLMPNPKTGTVTDDTATAVAQSKAGKVEFRMDRHGNISVPFGKLSFAHDKLVDNANSIVAGVKAAKPAGLKGAYIKTCTVSSTMGVGLRVNVKDSIDSGS